MARQRNAATIHAQQQAAAPASVTSRKPPLDHRRTGVKRRSCQTPTLGDVDWARSYAPLTDSEYEKLFGLAPDLTGDISTSDYIDRIRNDDDI